MRFPAAGLRFLADLENNNEREWFQPRKEEYEQVVRGPMIELVRAIGAKLPPEYATDPAKAVYRLYRDTRFSKDKTPYKTHIGALLWHRTLPKDGTAALYFHVSPKEFLVAGGVYKPPPGVLLAIRQHIASEHARLEKILRAKAVREHFAGGLQGERLSRPPKGWCADHPAVEFLRYKDLLLEFSEPAGTALRADVVEYVSKRFRAMLPFVDFLNEPLLARAKKPRDPLAR
jgi:uncharacterized protein (TIGR02453 family)